MAQRPSNTVKHGNSRLHPIKCHFVQPRFLDGSLMARWIAFDQETSSLLHNKLAHGVPVDTFGRGALDYALAKPGPVVALLPSVGGETALAVFRAPRRKSYVPQPPRNVAAHATQASLNAATQRVTRAGGFLGLSDEPILEEEQVVEKKGWWRKFWDE